TSASDTAQRYPLCQLCLEKMRACCEFVGYLRLIVDGHVHARDADEEKEVWEEIVRLRERIFWARIGGGVVPAFVPFIQELRSRQMAEEEEEREREREMEGAAVQLTRGTNEGAEDADDVASSSEHAHRRRESVLSDEMSFTDAIDHIDEEVSASRGGDSDGMPDDDDARHSPSSHTPSSHTPVQMADRSVAEVVDTRTTTRTESRSRPSSPSPLPPRSPSSPSQAVQADQAGTELAQRSEGVAFSAPASSDLRPPTADAPENASYSRTTTLPASSDQSPTSAEDGSIHSADTGAASGLVDGGSELDESERTAVVSVDLPPDHAANSSATGQHVLADDSSEPLNDGVVQTVPTVTVPDSQRSRDDKADQLTKECRTTTPAHETMAPHTTSSADTPKSVTDDVGHEEQRDTVDNGMTETAPAGAARDSGNVVASRVADDEAGRGFSQSHSEEVASNSEPQRTSGAIQAADEE
ncbi:rab guanine nucleotide exchange factor S2, partial [Ascosphaera acerosa]